jgi:hypothetical protein
LRNVSVCAVAENRAGNPLLGNCVRQSERFALERHLNVIPVYLEREWIADHIPSGGQINIVCMSALRGDLCKTFFGNSGAEAIEGAAKLARWHTRRQLFVAFISAFHGRTFGAVSFTASKPVQRRHFFPLVPGVTHVPYAYCYRCPYHHQQYPGCSTACVSWIREDLFKRSIPPEEVAAIFVEPIQGEGGYIVPPLEFHQNFTSWQGSLEFSLWMMRFRAEWEGQER